MQFLTRELTRHKFAYTALILGIVVLGAGFLLVWPDLYRQRLIAIAVGVLYVGWGIVTHVSSNHITKQILMEYLGVGTLVTIILLLLTL